MSSRARASARVLLRRTLYPALEAAWAGAFALAGQLSPTRRTAAHWRPAVGGRVMIVATHPDDEASGCGGVACLHREAGDPVAALVVTDGRASRAGGLSPGAMASCRAAESLAAAGALGLASLELAGLPEGEWQEDDGTAVIRRLVQVWRPAVVYAPSCVDFHPEHLRVARACAAALRDLPRGPALVRSYEAFVPLGPALVNLVADISPVVARKAAALGCYASQRTGLAQVHRRDRYTACLYAACRAAEAFCELSPNAYASLIEAGDWSGRRAPFRGLRGRPLTDPLAYLVGRRERRRLRRSTG